VDLEDAPGLEPLTADAEMVRGLSVRGKVTDKETGKPAAGALVEYYPLYANPSVDKLPGVWHPRSEATTGADGSYALTVLPGQGVLAVTGANRHQYMPAFISPSEWKAFFKTPIFDGRYLLWALGENLFDNIPSEQQWHTLVLLEPGEKEEGLVKDLVLEKPLERKGQVVGPDGKPLAGTRVSGLSPWSPLDRETLMGSEFIVRGINPKAPRQLLFFHKEKNLGFFLKELSGERDGPLTVKLEPCGEASGRMVDRDGQPVAGMRLDFESFAASGLGGPAWAVSTDKDGRFRAEGLVPGYTYTFRGLAPGVKYGDRVGSWRAVVRPGEKKDMGDIQAERKR
jgi:protocatechuate 3,4-dioxygenase beta subunit